MDFGKISVSDLTYELIPYVGKKAEEKSAKDLLRENRFTKSSEVSQRDFSDIEQVLYRAFSTIDFIELSPLQPLGINCFLANTNGKKLIPTIRGQEVNSDATTSLFLEAFRRFQNTRLDLATNVRTVRPKIFSAESKFLSHFKVFGWVTIDYQNRPFGINEVAIIQQHLFGELEALFALCKNNNYNIKTLNVAISNLVFAEELVRLNTGSITTTNHQKNDFEQVIKNLGNNFLNEYNHLALNDQLVAKLKTLGIEKGFKILKMFMDIFNNALTPLSPAYKVNFYFDLTRSAGLNYYRHICYSIIGINECGEKIPLGDGGSTNWAAKMSDNKQLLTVASGLGTEVLIRNFKKPAS